MPCKSLTCFLATSASVTFSPSSATTNTTPLQTNRLHTKEQKMSQSSSQTPNVEEEEAQEKAQEKAQGRRKLRLMPLVFVIFYQVSGGPFGIEDTVRAGGPFLAILGILIFPLIYTIPEALITAEMSTAFPEDSGFVAWTSAAFGASCGFQHGFWKYLSSLIDNALYPVLFLDYLATPFPLLSGGLPRRLSCLAITAALTCLNLRGLAIVGWGAVAAAIFTLLPFLVMLVVAVPTMVPSRWTAPVDWRTVNWRLFINTLFWNFNNWDAVSTISGEVESAKRTLPKALFCALSLTICAYLVPMCTAIGSTCAPREHWRDGYFAAAAAAIGGKPLEAWVMAATAVSSAGMFEAEMTAASFQLLGMSERKMLPRCFRKRSRHGTPVAGIFVSAAGVAVLSSAMGFQDLVAAQNILFCLGMLLEFVGFAVIRLRRWEGYSGEDGAYSGRCYRVPLREAGAAVVCGPPVTVLLTVIVTSSVSLMGVTLGLVFVGFVVDCARRRNFCGLFGGEDGGGQLLSTEGNSAA